MAEVVLRRADRVVWRQAHDRVCLRRVGDHGDEAQADVHGVAALLWVALDQPSTVGRLTEMLADAGLTFDPDEIVAGLQLMVDLGWARADEAP